PSGGTRSGQGLPDTAGPPGRHLDRAHPDPRVDPPPPEYDGTQPQPTYVPTRRGRINTAWEDYGAGVHGPPADEQSAPNPPDEGYRRPLQEGRPVARPAGFQTMVGNVRRRLVAVVGDRLPANLGDLIDEAYEGLDRRFRRSSSMGYNNMTEQALFESVR